eukprot:maker-scaffold703_size109190-snap-gene-0.16 protein:Tk04143 transcript:maker-scaffold703_size109190-snap-gene-0.16-mRNA-1 annotation:"sulfotransferase 1a1-like"
MGRRPNKAFSARRREMMWQIVNFDLDATVPILERSPFLEISCLVKSAVPPKRNPDQVEGPPPMHMVASIDYTDNMASPRVIKTHLPMEFLPPKLLDTCKVLYVCRNPKDTCVSYFNHCKIGLEWYQMHGSFEDFAQLFLDGTLTYGDYWHHLKGGWNLRNHPNFKFVWFEEMKGDHSKVIREVCEFTGHKRTEAEIEALCQHLTIDKMRQKAQKAARTDQQKAFASKFFRKGQVGDWKNYFQGEKLVEWDQWIKDNLAASDIVLPSC